MSKVLRLSMALSLSGVLAAAGEPASGHPAKLSAPDGTMLAASFYPASHPGPGILLLHQCNSDRSSWNGLAAELAARGFHVLALDYRGYGQSGGTPFNALSYPERASITTEKWPGDIDVAFAYLRAQPGVRPDVLGAAGASCGVNNSIQLSLRHPDVTSLVLLSGNTDRKGRQYLKRARGLPLLFAAADDDGDIVSVMAWMDATSGNPANRFLRIRQRRARNADVQGTSGAAGGDRVVVRAHAHGKGPRGVRSAATPDAGRHDAAARHDGRTGRRGPRGREPGRRTGEGPELRAARAGVRQRAGLRGDRRRRDEGGGRDHAS